MLDRYLPLVERFVAVSDEGSILNASRRLNISQPALTQSIQKIEALFNCKLFERTKKGVVLTVTGEVLYRRSQLMLEHSNLAQAEISDIVAGRAGSIRIVAGTVWAMRYLPPIVRELQFEFPELTVEIDVSLTPMGLERLHRGEIDLVVGGVHGDLEAEYGFQKELLVKQRYAVGCGPQSDLAHAPNVTISQVAAHPLVLYHDDELLMESVIDALESRPGISFKRAVLTRSVVVALEMALQGPYVVILAEETFRSLIPAGLHVVDLAERLSEFDTAVFYRESLRQTEPFERLLSRLKNVR